MKLSAKKKAELTIGQIFFLAVVFIVGYGIVTFANLPPTIALLTGLGAIIVIFLFIILAPLLAVFVSVVGFLLLLLWAFAPGNTLGWNIPLSQKSFFQMFAELFVIASIAYFAFTVLGFIVALPLMFIDFLGRIFKRIKGIL